MCSVEVDWAEQQYPVNTLTLTNVENSYFQHGYE